MTTLFFTTQQLAERWNITATTLCIWRCHKKGPAFVKLGHRVLYKIEDIEAFEKKHMVSSKYSSNRNAL